MKRLPSMKIWCEMKFITDIIKKMSPQNKVYPTIIYKAIPEHNLIQLLCIFTIIILSAMIRGFFFF